MVRADVSFPYILCRLPEMAPDETAYLNQHCRPETVVWEWGTGGSTLWFLTRVKHVTSVEHFPICFELLTRGVSQSDVGNTLTVLLRTPSDLYFEGTEDDGNYRQFAAYVDAYDGQPVDLFLVDGRARLACLARLRERAPKEAVILLHDATRYDYTGIADRIGGVGTLHRLRFK